MPLRGYIECFIMTIGMGLIINSILLGVGLAMDAFSVSLANGLNENGMGKGRLLAIAGTFAGFQFAMPMIGWFCVHSIAEKFDAFQKYIPWIALILLLYIGGDMLIGGIRDNINKNSDTASDVADSIIRRVGFFELMMQGVATSIDALSVGFTISDYNATMAFVSALIIGIVTYAICRAGLERGKTFGTKLAGKAGILGGVILIIIGIEIFITA